MEVQGAKRSPAIRSGTRAAGEWEDEVMIVLEDDERSGPWMPGTHDHEPQMMTDDELKNVPPGRAVCGGDRSVACADWLCAEEEWSYDLFDLQDSGLVPSY